MELRPGTTWKCQGVKNYRNELKAHIITALYFQESGKNCSVFDLISSL
jgi:hypothetical protein